MQRLLFIAAVWFAAAAHAQTSLVVRAAETIGSRCEVDALQLHMNDGSKREERFDPPLLAGVPRDITIPASAKTIAAHARGCWIGTFAFRGANETVLRAWPLATLTARHEPMKREPAGVRARFIDVKAIEGDELQDAACSREGPIARCDLPALRPMHVRIDWDGFAPVFAKNLAAKENGIENVGPVTLVPAHVVEGKVTSRDGSPIRDARIRLVSEGAAALPLSERILHTASTQSDAKGHFRIGNVASGSYRLVSHVEGLADVVLNAVLVADGDVVLAPLVHTSRARLELVLNPPAAADGTLWIIALQKRGARTSEVVVTTRGAANAAGSWTSEPLENAEYTVIVSNAFGAEVARQSITLNGRDELLQMKIDGVPVRGRLLSGDDGVAGDITFRNRSGQSVRTTTDGEGAFSASLPTAGTWRVQVATPSGSRTHVELPEVEIDDDPTGELELHLPAGRIDGIVKDAQGNPVLAAVIVRRDRRIVAQGLTGSDGKFTFAHLGEAPHHVEASAAEERFAPPVDADLSTEKRKEIELTLRRKPRARGVVTGPSGRPLSGAVVRVVDIQTTRWDETIADAEGAFSISMPSAGVIDVIVIAPPAPVTPRRFAPSQWHDQPIVIVVGAASSILRLQLRRIPPWPSITSADGLTRYLGMFETPQFGSPQPRMYIDGAFQFTIEPGAYTVCLAADCRPITLQPGASIELDFITLPEKP